MLDTGCGMLDTGCGMLDTGCGMLDTGCGMLDARYWMRDAEDDKAWTPGALEVGRLKSEERSEFINSSIANRHSSFQRVKGIRH
jgi:hypothetical protein